MQESKPLYSQVTLAGHPVHPMLVSFPVAFYTASLVCFIVFAATDQPFWFRVGYAANVAGVVMAAVAAIPGFIDWALGIPNRTRAKRDGAIHMGFNVAALTLFALNLAVSAGQWNQVVPRVGPAIVLSLVGVLFTLCAGWFGWRMVQTHHVGVQENTALAPLDAPRNAPVETRGGRRVAM